MIGTGESHTVREFVELAFGMLGPRLEGRTSSWIPALSRPADVDQLCRRIPRAPRAELGWKPTVGFRGLVRMMVESDVELVRRDARRHPEDRRLTPIEPISIVR